MSIPDTFSYSNGWLAKFKRRKGISSVRLHGEAASANPSTVTAGREQLQEDLKAFDPEDIYNIDETGLFYKLQPNQTLATKSSDIRGTKKSKERVTVALGANATGSHKLRPFLIGKSAKPRAFKNFDASLYVKYRSNKKAWMTSPLFSDWMDELNQEMKNAGRHIALVIDNASSHGKETQWSNVTIFFLPPNTTAHLQPMDGGIIRNFKCNYRRHTTRKYITQIEADQTPSVDMAECVRFVSRAWNEVSAKTIQNCWRHTGILPTTHATAVSNATQADADAAEAELSSLLQSAPGIEVSATELIECDSELPVGDDPTDEDILNICSPEEPSTSEDQSTDDQSPAEPLPESEEQPQPPVTCREALDCLYTAQKFWEQRGNQQQVDALQAIISATQTEQHKSAKQASLFNFFKTV